MPVDRSVSGIRVSGRPEKLRRTPRFPTQIVSAMNHRTPSPYSGDAVSRGPSVNLDRAARTALVSDSPPAAAGERHRHRAVIPPSEPPATARQQVLAHAPDRKTVLIGRVRAQSLSVDLSAGNSARDERQKIGGRGPVRAVIVGLLLAAAILVGGAVAAMTVGASPTPPPAVSDRGVPATNDAVTGAEVDGAGGDGEAIAPVPVGPTAPVPVGPTAPARSAPVPVRIEPDPAASVIGPFLPAPQGAVDSPATVSTLAPGDPGFGWPSTAFGSAP